MEGFRVVIDHDKMHVKLVAGNELTDPILSEEELFDYLRDNKVIKGILHNTILIAFLELPQLEEAKEFIIVNGTPPIHGADGKINFNVDITGKIQYFGPEDDDGTTSVDYKSAIGTPTIKKAECVCTISPPERGVVGYDIEGKLLSATDGKEAVFSLGDGVEFNSDNTKVFATLDGRPEFTANVISVSPIYRVNGDVNFETGNIAFHGHVFVTGSVQDDFSVDASTIEIKGCVGNSLITAEKELVIYEGVNGKNTEGAKPGVIKCKGDMLVKYLNDANVEVDGDLSVKNEIVHSEVKCNGRVTASRIIGGITIALKEVETNVLGSELGTATRIDSGINYRVKNYDDALASLSWQIDSLLEPFALHLGDNKYFARMTEKNRARVVAEYKNFLGLKSGYLDLLAMKEKMVCDEKLQEVQEVIVIKIMHSDILISTRVCHKKFMNEFAGPIVLVEDVGNKTIRINNYDAQKPATRKANTVTQRSCPLYLTPDGKYKVRLNYLGKSIYTKGGIDRVDKLFYNTIHGQEFTVCVFEDRYAQRIALINSLKKAGLTDVHGVKDSFHALQLVKELENDNIVVICNLHVGKKYGLAFVSNLMHTASHNYGVFLTDTVDPIIGSAIEKIPGLAIYDESIDAKQIVQQLRTFGLEF